MKEKINLDDEGCGPCGQGAYVDTTNYAECVPWESPEKFLLLGGRIVGAPFEWEDFMVLGSEVKTKHSGLVLDVQVDEETYQLFVQNYGTGSMLFSQAGGQGGLTRSGWKKMYGTDGLKGMILKTLNRGIKGGGVHMVT